MTLEDPLLEDESDMLFPSQDSADALHHNLPRAAGIKSIYALTNASSAHVTQNLGTREDRLTRCGSSLIVPMPCCGPLRPKLVNTTKSSTVGKEKEIASLAEVSSARRTFHESASSLGAEQIEFLFKKGFEEEKSTGSASKSNRCTISGTTGKAEASAKERNSEKRGPVSAVDKANPENPVKRLRRKSAPSKGEAESGAQFHMKQRIARYRSGSRRTISMCERRTGKPVHSIEEIYMYKNALFMEDSLVLDAHVSFG